MKKVSLFILLSSLSSLNCMNESLETALVDLKQRQEERESRLKQARKDLWNGLATKDAELVKTALEAGATPRKATPTVEHPYIEHPYTPEILTILKNHALDSYTGGI
jgi:hypothetical protein